VVKKQPIWHEVSGIQDDRRKHEEKEDIRGEGGGGVLGGEEQEKPDDDSNNNEKTGLGENMMELGCHVESNFGERRHKDPEGDDERNLHSLKLHMEDMIGWSPPMVVMHRGVVTKIKMVLMSRKCWE